MTHSFFTGRKSRVKVWTCTVLAVALFSVGLVALPADITAAAPVPSSGHIEQSPGGGTPPVITTSLTTWREAFFEVNVPAYSQEHVVQVEVSRVQDGAVVNQFPYWQGQERVQPGAATVVQIRSPEWAFQAGYDFTWRTRSWDVGEAPGAWSTSLPFSVAAVTDKPTPPYPMFPRWDVAVDDNILRADSSALPAADTNLSGRTISSYEFELKQDGSNIVLWTSPPVPAPAAGDVAEVNVPNILSPDTKYRWRVRAIDAAGRVGNDSRWRYMDTTGPAWKAAWDHIPDRAGAYIVGFEAADEASGLVASSAHTGVYWMIRDNGPGDRSALYAVKIGSDGLIENLDGYPTREIDVTGISNTDWESLIEAPGGGLLIGDIGDYWDGALQGRTDFALIHVPEPDPVTGTSVGVTATYPFSFPGGQSLNSEAMFTVGDWIYLITKDTQEIFRFPQTLSTAGNTLTKVGDVTSEAAAELITGSDISDDLTRLAVTLNMRRMVVFRRDATTAPTTAAQADTIVTELLVNNEPTWTRYYRRAAMLDAAGLLDGQGFDDPGLLQVQMQVEGAAFANGSYDVAMISEYGKHLLYTTSSEYQADSYPLAVKPETVAGTSLKSQGYAADPVNIATGNFTDTWTDISYGVADPLLGFGRTYNAQNQGDGPLGRGWSVTYDDRLNEVGDDVHLVTNEGRLIVFTSDGQGGWNQPGEFSGTLTDDGDNTYSIEYPDGTTVDFDTDGRIATVADWANATVTIARNVNGLATSAASSTGRSVSFAHDNNDHLTTVTTSDGQTMSFTYNAAGDLTDIDHTGNSWAFAVDTDGRVVELRDGENRLVVANVYDEESRVTEQTTPTGEKVWFSYDNNIGVTTMTDGASGDVNVYSHDAGGRLINLQDPTMADVTRTYDENGYLATATDRLGNTVTYETNHTGQIEQTTTTDGAVTTEYDTSGRPTKTIDTQGSETVVAYTGTNRIPSTITNTVGTTTITTSSGRLASVTDPAGSAVSYTYDSAGNLATQTDPSGGVSSYTYDAAGRLLTSTDPSGATTTNTYGPTGLLATIDDPITGLTAYTYDDAGNKLTETDADGGVITYTYNSAGLVSSITDAIGGVTSYTYNTSGELQTVTDRIGGTTTYTYGPLGRLIKVADALGNETTYTHDLEGQILTSTDPLGNTTTYEYDTAGRTTSVTDPAGGETETTYDSKGRVSSVTDPTGITTTNAYDAAGNLISTTSPAGTTTYGHDPVGRPTSVADAEGNTTTYGYDAAGRQTTVTDPTGAVETTAYDAAGRVTSVIDAAGNTTTYGYDAAGNLISTTDPAGTTTYGYDNVGRQTSETDPTGNTTTYGYDAAGRQTTVTDPTGAVETTAYDAAGRVTSVTDATGNTTTYGYDAAGRQTSETTPTGASKTTTYDLSGRVLTDNDFAGGITTLTFDTAGRLDTVTNPTGNTTTHTYDAASRLTTRTFDDGTSTSYTYDAAGRRLTMTDPTGTTNYTYTTAGRISSTTDPSGAQISYTWSATNQPATITYPDSSTVTYNYTSKGQLADLTHPDLGTITYSYDSVGRPSTVDLPGNQTRSYTYDATGLLASFVQSIDSGAQDTTITRDPAGRISAADNAGQTTAYTYDPAGQLTSAGATTYQYGLGRRTDATTPTTDSDYTYDPASQITSLQTSGGGVGGAAHVIVGDSNSPATGDQSVIDRLEDDLGYTVTLIDDGAAENVTGADLVVITQSVGTSQITGKYVDEAVPMLTMSAPTWDEHNLVAAQSNSYPYTTSGTLVLEQATHPTVDGATSPTATTGVTIGYAFDTDIPADADIIAAAKASATDRASLVVFETGDNDAANNPVPAKRALLGFHRNAFADLTTGGGWAIFDQTINWLNPQMTSGVTSYDAAGRATQIGNIAISYDARGQATQITTTEDSGSVVQDRTYNGDGQLVDLIITTPGGATEDHHFVWDNTGSVPQILAHSIDGQTNNYIYGNHREAVIRPDNTSDLFAYDHRGSVVATPATSDLTAAGGYDSYGTPATGTDPSVVGFGYRGELHTGPTIYLRNRDYLPEHAVFTTVDPLAAVPGTPTTSNPYHYANNNPINEVDPLGLRPSDSDYVPDQLAFTIPTPDVFGLEEAWESTKGWFGKICFGAGDGCESALSIATNGRVCSRIPRTRDDDCDSYETVRESMDEVSLVAGTTAFWCSRFGNVLCAYPAGAVEAAAAASSAYAHCNRPGPIDRHDCDSALQSAAGVVAGAPAWVIPGPPGALWDGTAAGWGWLSYADSQGPPDESPRYCSVPYDAPPQEGGYKQC